MQVHHHTDRENQKTIAFVVVSDGKGSRRGIIAESQGQRRGGLHRCGGTILHLAEGLLRWVVCEKCGADLGQRS